MIDKKRTWKDCEDQKILAIFNEIKDEAKRLYPQYFESTVYKFYIDSSTSHLGRCAYELDASTIYNKYGFTEHIKDAQEVYPDGTTIDVEYYGKKI